MTDWQPIETAPRDSSRILIAYKSDYWGWSVKEAWWRLAYDGAPMHQCSWQTDKGIVLSADLHISPEGKRLGATHWMPLPDPPK